MSITSIAIISFVIKIAEGGVATMKDDVRSSSSAADNDRSATIGWDKNGTINSSSKHSKKGGSEWSKDEVSDFFFSERISSTADRPKNDE